MASDGRLLCVAAVFGRRRWMCSGGCLDGGVLVLCGGDAGGNDGVWSSRLLLFRAFSRSVLAASWLPLSEFQLLVRDTSSWLVWRFQRHLLV